MYVEAMVLGSGQDGGTPQFGAPSHRGPMRTASSVAIRAESGRVVILDASPDIRAQWLRLNEAGWATAITDIAAVAVTHAHMGHYAGLVHFGKEAANTQQLPLIALDSVHEFLVANEPWATLYAQEHVARHDAATPFALGDRITVEAVQVPHRAEFSDTAAFSVVVEGEPWLLYLPDIDSWEAWDRAIPTISNHQISLVDATFADADELPGRDLAAIKHPLVTDTIGRFGTLTPTNRIVLTHLNHSNAVNDPTSSVARAAADGGFEVAFDGMRIGMSR